MKEYQKSCDIPDDFTVTSQSLSFYAICNNYAENDPFLCGFYSVSKELGLGQVLYFMGV